jgi:alkylation response protein AidB-like acyl-CoA dehydrogenase
MSAYKAPLKDISFVLNHIVEAHELANIPAFEMATPDIQEAILVEGAKFVEDILAPLNVAGDKEGSRLEGGEVKTPEGFADAYRHYCDGGWNGISGPVEFGGQGMPLLFGGALQEMISSANMAFGLCPMLGQGAVQSIMHHGTPEQQKKYLEKLVTGEWTGSMNLTEPSAGSDVGALRTRAEPRGDGSYLIKGQKIFITYGDHDFTDNIIHLVLARLPGAPAGTRGISLFIVPKFMVGDDGSLGWRNDARAVSLEHKLGIHASPTCVMSYGDNDNCIGYLLGEENKGMRCMFTMMNHARLNVGLQGVGIAETAYQKAAAYASERIQGNPIGATKPGEAIIGHADVRRSLLTIKALSEASRAIAYLNAKAIDVAHAHEDEEARAKAQGLADLLTPMTKAFASDNGVECASLALQVHGGMGYIEETGIAQLWRDSRIAPIYEGSNGIQAQDLAGRKLMMDGGLHWQALLGDIRAFAAGLPVPGDLGAMGASLSEACRATEAASRWLVERNKTNMRAVAAAATPYLRLFSMTLGAYLLAKGAVVAAEKVKLGEGDTAFFSSKIIIARFFAEQLLPPAIALAPAITGGDDILFSLTPEQLAG